MSRSAKESRPKIWAEGAQNPPLQPRAFALASVLFARDSLSGLLMRCGGSADGFGQIVATGRWRVPPHRLGRTGRYLPTVAHVATSLLTCAEVLRRAAQVAQPAASQAASAQPVAQPHVSTARIIPRPVRPVPQAAPRAAPQITAPTEAADDADLAAIRALMASAATQPEPPPIRAPTPRSAPLRPASVNPAPSHTVFAQDVTWRRDWLMTGAATGLGYGLLALSLPVGATRALMAHLNGEDLRDLVGLPQDTA